MRWQAAMAPLLVINADCEVQCEGSAAKMARGVVGRKCARGNRREVWPWSILLGEFARAVLSRRHCPGIVHDTLDLLALRFLEPCLDP